MDKSYFNKCARMIDDLDLVIANSRTQTGRNGKLLVLSSDKQTGPKSARFIKQKLQLLATLREHFIEPVNKSLRISALLSFCHQSGLTLVTYKNKTHVRSSFVVRTAGFDLVVDTDY